MKHGGEIRKLFYMTVVDNFKCFITNETVNFLNPYRARLLKLPFVYMYVVVYTCISIFLRTDL